MQAIYSNYSITSGQKKNANIHFKQKEYMERSEKRTPYENSSNKNGGDKKESAGVVYILLTLILLMILYPVGLFMLWVKKIKWNWATKFLITIITAIIFCMLVIFALNAKVENPKVKHWQKQAREGLGWVYDITGDLFADAEEWTEQQAQKVKDNASMIWDRIDDSVAERGLDVYHRINDNLYAAKYEIPQLLLDYFKEKTDYQEKEITKTVENEPSDIKGINVTVSGVPRETPAPTSTPTATPTPKPTATPTPTPVPITLPSIKNVGQAEVFFTQNGTYYHETENCSGMMNAVSHTLNEAKEAGKKTCPNCKTVPYSMLECEYYLWVDTKNVVHTTDECTNFYQTRYSVLPFEDIYESNYTYCVICGGSTCFDYMRQHDAKFNVAYDDLSSDMRALYDYEKTVTVYYGENSRNYHANQECTYLYDEKYIHTLYQALHVDGKQRCAICLPLTEEMAAESLANP